MKSTKKLLSKVGVGTLGILAGVGVFLSVASASIFNSSNLQETVADDTFYQVSYDKTATENGKISILLSGELKSYKNLSKDKVKGFLSAVRNAAVDAFADDLGDQLIEAGILVPLTLGDFQSIERNPYYVAQSYATLDVAFLERAVLSSMSGGTGTYSVGSITGFKLDSRISNEQMVKYLADRYATAYSESSQNPDDKATALTKIAQKVSLAAQNQADITYAAAEIPEPTPLVGDVVTGWISDLSATEPYQIGLTDFTNLYQALLNDMTLYPSTTYMDDLFNKIGGDSVKQEIYLVLMSASADEISECFTQVQPTHVAQVLKSVEFDRDDMLSTLDKIGMSRLVDISREIDSDGLREIFSACEGLTKSDLSKYIKNNYRSVSLKKLWSIVDGIVIDTDVVYSGKKFIYEGLKEVIKSIPRPSVIAKYTDDQMKLERLVTAITSFGDVQCDVTFGFYGNCDAVRKVAQILADTFTFSKENGVYKIGVNVPNLIGRVIKYIDDNDLLDDEMKNRVFDFLFSTLEEMYDKFMAKTWASVIADLKSLDYAKVLDTVMSAENLNKLFGTDKFTEERVDKLVNMFMSAMYYSAKGGSYLVEKFVKDFVQLEGYETSKIKEIVDKVVDLANRFKAKNIDAALLRELLANGTFNDKVDKYIDKLAEKENLYVKVQNMVTRLYDLIPDRYYSKTIMDAYKGDGLFQVAGTYNIDIKQILNAITPQYGDKIYSYVSGLIDAFPTKISLDMKATVKNMRSVTYLINGEKKQGMLTEGMDVPFYANKSEIVVDAQTYDIAKWIEIDESGNPLDEITTMPLRDITVVPVTDFDIESSAGVNTIFDNNYHDISVTVSPANPAYTYQWQKLDEGTGDYVDINGATSATYQVRLVSDSGKYRCKVEYPGYLTKYSTDDNKDPITVIITEATIDLSTVEFNYDPLDPFVYSGSEYTIDVVGTSLPTGLGTYYTYTMTEEYAKTAAGDYRAIAKFEILPEYATQLSFVNGEGPAHNLVSLDWSILQKVVSASDLNLKWIDANGNEVTNPLVYSAENQTIKLDETLLPNYVTVSYADNTAKDAGNYTAVATFGVNDANYVINPLDKTDSKDFTINPYVLDFGQMALSEDTFTYDGNEKEVAIDNATLPGLLGSDTNAYTVTFDSSSSYDYKATNAGDYTANAIVTITNSNYTSNLDSMELDWTIEQAEIVQADIDAITWSDLSGQAIPADGFVYDGSAKGVKVANYDSSKLVLGTYTDNSKTDAGTYTASVALSATSNYKFATGVTPSASKSWKINPKTIVASDFASTTWVDQDGVAPNYVYTGDDHTMKVINLPTGVSSTVQYSGEYVQANAGNYTCTATFAPANGNYVIANDAKTMTLNWSIGTAEINFSSMHWDSKTEFTYDGSEKSVALLGNAPAGEGTIYSKVLDNKATNAGNYTAKVTYTLIGDAANNYVITHAPANKSWKINKAKLDFGNVKWATTSSFVYDGNEHSIELVGNAPAGEGTIYTKVLDNTGVNAGNYTAKVTYAFIGDNGNNYVMVNTPGYKLWTIEKATLDFSNMKWSTNRSVEYNGNEQSLELLGNAPAGEGTIYSKVLDNTGVDAGDYVAKVTYAFIGSNGDNYAMVNLPQNVSWTITKIAYSQADFAGVTWVNTEVVYDGQAHTVAVDSTTLPDYTEVVAGSYVDATKTDAGYYKAKANVQVTNNNYEIKAGVVLECNWVINKAEVTKASFNNVKFTDGTNTYAQTDTPSFTYNGAKVTLTLKSGTYEIAGVQYSTIINNQYTNAGSYKTIAVFTLANDNYYFESGFDGKISINWSIGKRNVTIDDIAWIDNNGQPVSEGASFAYSGQAIVLTIDPQTIEAGVKLVSYTGNSKTYAGSYKAVATFAAANNNYNLVGATTAELNWSISKVEIDISSVTWDYNPETPFTYDGSEKTVTLKNLPDGAGTKYFLTYNGNVARDVGSYVATANILVKDSYNYVIKGNQPSSLSWKIVQGSTKVSSFVSLQKDSAGNPHVKIEYAPGLDSKYLLNGIKEDETQLGLEKLDWTGVFGTNGGYVYAVYDIYFQDGAQTVPMDLKDGSKFVTYVLIPEDIRTKDTLKVVHIAEDGKISEFTAQKEGNYMKFETTHFSRYALVEIKGTAIPWWVFAIIALCVVIVILQIIILCKKGKKGEPVVEKHIENIKHVEEIKKVEIVQQVEQKPAEPVAPVEPAQVAAPVEPEEEQRPEQPEENYIIAEDGTKQLLVRSFAAKLCQTNDEVKSFYNDFKNNIMAYRLKGKEKVRSVVSWKYEAFYAGRDLICKLKIKRKNLMIYAPIDPKQFDGTPIKVENVGDVKATADTPTLMVITSDRKVKYANKMVDQVLTPLGLKLDEKVERVDYLKGYRYASNKTLLAKGLIKTTEAPADLFKN